VGAVIIFGTGVKIFAKFPTTPDDHFASGPHCRVIEPASGRVGGAGRCPTVDAWVVPPAGVQNPTIAASAPYNHFTAGPDCRGLCPAIRRVGGAGRCPTISAGIVSPAGVKAAVYAASVPAAAPDDH